ncbi:MAG: Gfo/Idh/MocA family oxidoreductase, partial [Candidatus Latescibacterota bacterium]
MVGIGVIGFGYWGPNLVRNVASLPEAQLRVVCDRSADRLLEVGRLYPGVDLVDSVVDVLNRSDIDAVILATPADTHFDLARRVLESGRAVFVEKPLARSASECEQLIELAAQKDLVLMVGHTFEYNAAVEYVDDLISRRDLGQIYY